MGLETPAYLDDLVTTNPVAGDPRSEGDDHIRNLKVAAKNTFPGLAGRVWRKQTKAIGYTVIATDNMTWLNCTAALTLTLTAAATIGNGFAALVHANGGDVILDGNAAETVNGAATFTLPNGRGALLVCDGSAWRVFMLNETFKDAPVTSRAANTILALADQGKVFRATATFTQTLTAAATLGDGWYCFYKIDSGVTITFDPNAAETIDGAATRAVTGPAGLMIVCDGSNFHALGGSQQDAAPSIIPTGTVTSYVGSSAPTGWVMLSGRTIGNGSSGGTERANADTETLFTLLWNSMADAQAPVSTGRGASAAADFAANKTITLPDARGRGIFGKDDMGGTAANRVTNAISGITATTLGISGGDQRMTAHTHGAGSFVVRGTTGSGGGETLPPAPTGGTDFSSSSAVSGTSSSTGAGASENMPPALVLNLICKL